MKIAYLITAYDNPRHLNRLIESLQTDNAHFFIHIDKKTKYTFDIPKAPNITKLENRINVFWGSFTFIKAVILLIKESFKYGPFEYYVLLSGTDYPVRSRSYIEDFLYKNKSSQYVNISKMPANNKPLTRVEHYYFSEYDKSLNIVYILKRLANLFIRLLNVRRKLPEKFQSMTLYGGSTWWAMAGECIKYIIDFVDNNPEFVKYYKNTLIPEEMFFHTILGNSKFMKNVKPSFTYADWPKENLAHPMLITEKHIPLFKQKIINTSYGEAEILFARKFNDDSGAVCENIQVKYENPSLS